MTNTELKNLCKQVTGITKVVGKFILDERKKFTSASIEKKGHNDFVSYVDKSAEIKIVEYLKQIFPEAGFITEEATENIRGKHFNWIIDPLDGTTNFIHGIPCFCISIALIHHEELVLGVVHELNLDECFYAWKDGGAFLNDLPISVSTVAQLSDSLIATGFPYHDYDRMIPYMKVFDWCMKNTHGLRRLGSAAADLAYVACGRFESFYEYGLNSWDVAGGALIVKEAGGTVTDFTNGTDFIFGAELIASNSLVHNEIQKVISHEFNS